METKRKRKPELDSQPIRSQRTGRPVYGNERGSQRRPVEYRHSHLERQRHGLSEEERHRQAAEKKRERRRRKRQRRIALLAALLVLVAAAALALYFLLRPQEELPPVDFSRVASQEATQTENASSGSADTEAPVIQGVQDQTVEVGESISYKSGVTVTDNVDTNLAVQVDASQVELETPGTYVVTYTAVDSAGNQAEPVTATITVVAEDSEPESGEEEEMMAMAQSILDSLVTEDMDQLETAHAIYEWCRGELRYVDSSDKSSWIQGALQAFETRSGDCFNNFAAAKALLTAAGIENMDVEKSDTSYSSHYWSLVNCGDGWYHFDTTPRRGGGDYFFMVTDAQLEEYSEAHHNSHIFDHSLYPATNTEIITDLHAMD